MAKKRLEAAAKAANAARGARATKAALAKMVLHPRVAGPHPPVTTRPRDDPVRPAPAALVLDAPSPIVH